MHRSGVNKAFQLILISILLVFTVVGFGTIQLSINTSIHRLPLTEKLELVVSINKKMNKNDDGLVIFYYVFTFLQSMVKNEIVSFL